MLKCLGVILISLAVCIFILLHGSVVYIGTELSKVMVPDINMEEGDF
jgi:hypothetical protein